MLSKPQTFFRLFQTLGALVCALFLANPANAAGVRQFTPLGQINDQQIRATAVFVSDMVPLGRLDAPSPFTVDCGPVKGKARWSDAKTWAYTLERPLQAGERCDFFIKPGLKALNGDVATPQTYSFFAAGPWPRSVTPSPNSAIEEDQAFLIDAGGPLKRESVEQNLWCEADGVGQRIPVRFLSAENRQAILIAEHRKDIPSLIAVTCSERLPPKAKMRLVWGAGIETQTGVKSSRPLNYSYTVREPFRVSFSCEREKSNAPCTPLAAMRLDFSASVDAKKAREIRLVLPDGSVRHAADNSGEGERVNVLNSLVFKAPFPQSAELKFELPADFKDEAGRVPENAASFPLKIKTGVLPPLAKFPGAFGILELKEGGVLPVTLRNVETSLPVSSLPMPAASAHRFTAQRLSDDAEVIAAIKALAKFEQQTKTFKVGQGADAYYSVDPYYAREFSFLKGKAGISTQTLPKPGDSKEFEVVGIPLKKPGFHIVEIESQLLGAALLSTPKPMYVRTTALVTNLAVHFKRGQDNALVWVTTLDTGKPVADADVRLSNCDGKLLWQGKSDAQGRALINAKLGAGSCKDASFLFASARLGEDYSFARSDWNEGIEPWRFGVETWGDYSPLKIHSVFDRTLLRAGQTVSMKHIARERNSDSFAFPKAQDLPNELVIRHSGSQDEFRQPVQWDARGVATNEWKIPESAKRGTYSVELRRSLAKSASRPAENSEDEVSRSRVATSVYTGEFRVSDFRLPVFTGSVQGVPSRLVAPKEVPLALALSFLNGGAAKGTPVEVSATVRPRWPSYKGYEGFSFQVDFDEKGREVFAVDDGRQSEELVVDKKTLQLDNAGAGKLSVALPNKVKGPSELYAEMTFPDPNGEIQTIHGSVELAPSGVSVGLRIKDWTSVSDSAAVDVIVLDAQGKPLANAPVKVLAKRRVDYSHRKRIVGGFYAYENHTEFTDMGEVCSGKTDARGKIACTPKTSSPGNVYLLAQAQDKDGNLAYAGTSYWVSGGGDQWFTAGNEDRIDVIPEKKSYAPGETARLQVRTPFREATALVSVEAGGIIDTRVVALSRFESVIELPIKGEWGPNAFVSVLVVRGRLEPLKWHSFFTWGWHEPAAWFKEWWNPSQPTAMVDLAKPAYKIGLASIDIGTDAFKLKVDVTPEKADYAPRDTAKVRVKVTQPDGKPLPAGSEVAFAAVDQALLELRLNDSWNLLDPMLPRRAYQVETATAQSQVIGKRHFGKKAVPPGGGGGRAPARELFDTLLLWNPRVVLDANGSAVLDVPLNDSLSEFTLVAIADVGVGFFGTGSGRVRTKQDLQLISGLPPLVREKDHYSALLTVRNSTAKAMSVTLSAKTSSSAGEQALSSQEVKVEPESASEVVWTAEVPEEVNSLVWEFSAAEKAGDAKDRLRITQQVIPAVPVNVQQASFMRVEGAIELPTAVPTGALSGKNGPFGGIEVGLSAKLSTPPPGLKRFFEEYPFICLEQKASVAVGLRDKVRWQQIVDALPTYLDTNGLARYYPGDAQGNAGSPVLTAHLLDISQSVGFIIPKETLQRMSDGLLAYAEGRIKPVYWSPQNDLVVRKLAVIEALTRHGQTPLSALSSLEIEPMQLPTSALIDWYSIARRLKALPQRTEKLAAVNRELRNRLSYLGGRLVFTTERADYWWWLMVSGDSNSFRLIDAVVDDPAWKDDLPALVQGAILRQQRGRWLTTVANVWASIALDRFGQRFEKEAVSGRTQAALGQAAVQSFAWPDKASEGGQLQLPWPAKPQPSDKLRLTHEGQGQPWAAVQVLAAVPITEARANGFRVTREVTPVQEKIAGKASRGDVWRVRLTVDSEQEMSWVVLNDPIPAGARILGEGDGRDSHIATLNEGAGRTDNRAWPAYIERTFSAYRAYYAYVPRGKFVIDYTVRLGNAGEFSLPATRVEAMYAPEVFSEAPNKKVRVE